MTTKTGDRVVTHAAGADGRRRAGRGRVRRAVVGAVVGLGLVAAGATAAQAARVSVGGGTWHYGVTALTPNTNYSNYYHFSRWHGSSVTGDAGLRQSPCVGPIHWSFASRWDSNPFRIDHAYWRYC